MYLITMNNSIIIKGGHLMKKIFITSYDAGDKKGIYYFNYDPKTNGIDNINFTPTKDYPSYLIKKENHLFVSLKDASDNKSGGGIQSYTINDNNIQLLSDFKGKGVSYTHLDCANEKLLIAANFHGGSVDTFKLDNCSIKNQQQSFLIDESKIHYVQQIDSICYAVDLNLNKVYTYNNTSNILEQKDIIKIDEKKGPRHLLIDKNNNFLYLVCEVKNCINVYDITNQKNKMIQSITTLDKNFNNISTAAAIKFSICQNYIFVSNRGADCITLYKRDLVTGLLTLVLVQPCKKTPRDLCVVDDLIFVACQDSDCIQIYKFTNEELILIKEDIKISSPVCISN